MKKKLLLLTFLLSIFAYFLLFSLTTLNDSEMEKSCEGAFSSGRWMGDDVWDLVLGSGFSGSNEYLNCQCSPFAITTFNEETGEVRCDYHAVKFAEEECLENGMRWDPNYTHTRESDGTCFCDLSNYTIFKNRQENNVRCVPEDTYQDYLAPGNKDLSYGWIKTQILMNIISYLVILVFSFLLIKLALFLGRMAGKK